jgi:hypothetical protein
MLFIPGANAAMLSTSFVYGADAVMFDLEDAVSLREKTPPDCWFIMRYSILSTATLRKWCVLTPEYPIWSGRSGRRGSCRR